MSMKKQSSKRRRDYDLPMVWHDPVEFDMAEAVPARERGDGKRLGTAERRPVKQKPSKRKHINLRKRKGNG
jgi:hypothetical protein